MHKENLLTRYLYEKKRKFFQDFHFQISSFILLILTIHVLESHNTIARFIVMSNIYKLRLNYLCILEVKVKFFNLFTLPMKRACILRKEIIVK